MFPEALLVVAVLPLVWAFVSIVISLLSGWDALSQHYRVHEPFEGAQFSFCSAVLGWANYNNCLTVRVNADGLLLSVPFPFRLGHPPLFIPWPDIDAEPVKGWLFHYLDLRFHQVPGVRLRLARSLAVKIFAAANRPYPADPPAPSPTE